MAATPRSKEAKVDVAIALPKVQQEIVPEASTGSGSRDRGSREETYREYDRHLALAYRQDLESVAATRALCIAGEDRQGRPCVVFTPNLILQPPTPRTRRSNSRTPISSRGVAGKNGSPSPPGIASARRSPPLPRVAGALERAAAAGASNVSRKDSFFESTQQSTGPRRSQERISGSSSSGEPRNDESPKSSTMASSGALEGDVGSAEVECLMLYFVKLLDRVADQEYVLLLCGGDRRSDAGGWLTWGRFSMLGQLHSLLPRRYKKNLAALVVFQPTPVLHSFFEFANLFLSPKFYQKLEFCNGIAELAIRFPGGIIENLPEGALAGEESGCTHTPTRTGGPRRHSSCRVSSLTTMTMRPSDHNQDSGGGANHAAHGGATLTGDAGRPSPVRVTRVFGGGIQVQGDENWSPPPLPPPPLEVAPKPRSPILNNGGARGTGQERSRRALLEKHFSTSSATTTTGPATLSPAESASSACGGGRIIASSGSNDAGLISNARSGSSSNFASPNPTPTAAAGGRRRETIGASSAGYTAAELFSSSPAGAFMTTTSTTPTRTPTKKHKAQFGGGVFASVPAGGSMTGAHGVSPSSSSGSFHGVRSQQRPLGSAKANFSRRRSSSTGGCWERGKGPVGVTGVRTGGVSPTTPKGPASTIRRSTLSNGTSSLSPWSAAAAISGDRPSPLPSPSPRGRRAITPKGTLAQRSSWGGSPCSGGGWRSGPTTPRQSLTTTLTQVSVVSFVSPGTPARKGSGRRARGGSSPLSHPQGQRHRHVQQEPEQRQHCYSWPSSGGVGRAGARVTGTSHKDMNLSPKQLQRMQLQPPQQQQRHRSRRIKSDGRAADPQEAPEPPSKTGATSSAGPGQAMDGRRRHSCSFRRSSSGQDEQQRTKSPLRPRPRSSSNLPSPTQLAALEREVEICSARVASSAARAAGFVRFNGVSRSVSGDSGSSGLVAVHEEMPYSPSGRGAGGVGRVRVRDRDASKTTATSTTTRVTSGGASSRSRSGTDGGSGSGTAADNNCDPGPADHPAPLRRASEGTHAAATTVSVALAKAVRGQGGGGTSAGVTGRSSESGTALPASASAKVSTSARISPGIQALMANYAMAARGSSFTTATAKTATSAASSKAAAAGAGAGGRGAKSAPSPRARRLFSGARWAAGNPATPRKRSSVSVPSVFASAPTGARHALAGAGAVAGAVAPVSTTDTDTADGREGSPAAMVPKAQQQQRRSQHRNDAEGVGQALREHRVSLIHALEVEAAAVAAVAEPASMEQEVGDGMNRERDLRRRPEAVQRRRVSPDPKNKVFGVPLIELMHKGEDIPWILKRFVEFLTKFGLESVGLFRLAGDGMDCADLRDALDSGKEVCWDPTADATGPIDEAACRSSLMDVNMVAQLLKAFCRELPEPLIPFSAYSKVIAIAKAAGVADARWVQAMKNILWAIPNANYNCLRFLFEFLREVAMHSSTNRMTSENLAIVWAPNLLRPQDDGPFAILRDLRFQIETVRWMMDCCDELFND